MVAQNIFKINLPGFFYAVPVLQTYAINTSKKENAAIQGAS